jgi:hypothetical protein
VSDAPKKRKRPAKPPVLVPEKITLPPAPPAIEGHAIVRTKDLTGQLLAWAACSAFNAPAMIDNGIVRVNVGTDWLPFSSDDMIRSLLAGIADQVYIPNELMPKAESTMRQMTLKETVFKADEFHCVAHVSDVALAEFMATKVSCSDDGICVTLELVGTMPAEHAAALAVGGYVVEVIPQYQDFKIFRNIRLAHAGVSVDGDQITVRCSIYRTDEPEKADVPPIGLPAGECPEGFRRVRSKDLSGKALLWAAFDAFGSRPQILAGELFVDDSEATQDEFIRRVMRSRCEVTDIPAELVG